MVKNKFQKDWVKMQVSAHETTVIDEPVQIGENTKIWHNTHIRENVKIGKNCMIGEGCYIDEGVNIGDNVRIQNSVNVYKGVIIEDGVYVGPGVTFMNKRKPLDDEEDYQITLVRRGATIGANATILCGVTICENSSVAAGALVNKIVKANAFVIGNPAITLKYKE